MVRRRRAPIPPPPPPHRRERERRRRTRRHPRPRPHPRAPRRQLIPRARRPRPRHPPRRQRARRPRASSRVAAPADAAQRPEGEGRPPRREWRNRPPRHARSGESRDGGHRGERADRPPRERGAEGRGEFRKKGRGRGPGGKGKRPFGREREEHGRKPEQKLYVSESTVDHGFQDVPPAEEGGEARRVDWTITKRMVVDQRSTRTVSAVYVLKREGTETEFPFLAAAREAVNKKIVHPEKLTRPKEDYAALYTKK